MDTIMKPRTPIEHKMRNEVRTLRQQEERSALGRMRDWQRHASGHVDDRMNRYKDLTLDEINDFGDHMKDKIQHEEEAEERGGVSRRNHPHEKNHGIEREVDRLEQQIARLRDKESTHVQHDMKEGYRHKEANAVMGMRENQAKDEKQIVELTRRLSKKSFAKSKVSDMKVKKKEKVVDSRGDSFPGYGTNADRTSVGTGISRSSSRNLSVERSYKSMSAPQTKWQFILSSIRPPTSPNAVDYSEEVNVPKYIRDAEFHAELAYKSLGIDPEITRENIARSFLRPSFIEVLSKKFVDHSSKPGGGSGSNVSSEAGAAPFFSSRAYLAGKEGYDAKKKTFTSQGPLDHSEWEANAKAAHDGGKGWLHGYTDPTGRFMARSADYHKAMGTDAKKGTMLALSVKNPFSIDQKSGQANRTVMIGVNMPNGKVQHLMWHQEPGQTTGRYIPVHGVDHNGFAIQHEDSFLKGNYGNKALQHMCEHAALHLPGTNFTQEDEIARQANPHASAEQVTMASSKNYLPQLVSRDRQEGLFKQINESSASNTPTFNVDEKISESQGIDHATGQRLPGRQTSKQARMTAANELNQNMHQNIRAGFQDAFTQHQAAISSGQTSPFASWQHTGANADFSKHDPANGNRLDLHDNAAHT